MVWQIDDVIVSFHFQLSISYALFFTLEYSSVNAQVMEMKGVTQLNDTGILTIVFIVQ